jgi:hypothetical protein
VTIMLAAKIGIAVGFILCGILARVIYNDEKRSP